MGCQANRHSPTGEEFFLLFDCAATGRRCDRPLSSTPGRGPFPPIGRPGHREQGKEHRLDYAQSSEKNLDPAIDFGQDEQEEQPYGRRRRRLVAILVSRLNPVIGVNTGAAAGGS